MMIISFTKTYLLDTKKFSQYVLIASSGYIKLKGLHNNHPNHGDESIHTNTS